MSSESAAATSATEDAPRASRSVRPELLLLGAAVLCLALIPVHIREAYGGLPAHPLLLHVPVITIPALVIWSLLLVVRPAWVGRQGLFAAALGVVALIGTVLTVGAGDALREALHLGASGSFGPGALIARHAHAADILRILMFAFVIVLILYVLARRVTTGLPLGRPRLDRALSSPVTARCLAALVVALAVANGYFVFHTGDLGAKAVWAGRLQGRPGGGLPSGGFPGSGSGAQQRELFDSPSGGANGE